jgi:hypothetical protein
VGDAGADFKNLAGMDGKTHSIDDKTAKGLVLCFTCNHVHAQRAGRSVEQLVNV